MLSKSSVHSIFDTFKVNMPNPQSELHYKDPYTLLVAVMLSAQTTDVAVNKATPSLFALADTPSTMLNISVDQVKNCIKTLSFFNTKAENILKLSRILVEKHHGQVPHDREALEALPGVGRKTANVVLNIAFGEPTLAVDTHIHRVANRIGFCKTKDPLKTEQALLKIIPKEYLHDAHHWLILHGRYTCKARKPECNRCPIRTWCTYPNKVGI